MSEVNLRTTLSSMKCKVPSNGEMANSDGQFSWTSEAKLGGPSQGIGFQTELRWCWCPTRVEIYPFSSTWRMLVPSAIKTFPSTPIAIPAKMKCHKIFLLGSFLAIAQFIATLFVLYCLLTYKGVSSVEEWSTLRCIDILHQILPLMKFSLW